MTLVQLGHGADGEIEAEIVREECGELGRSVCSEGEPSTSSPTQWGGGTWRSTRGQHLNAGGGPVSEAC